MQDNGCIDAPPSRFSDVSSSLMRRRIMEKLLSADLRYLAKLCHNKERSALELAKQKTTAARAAAAATKTCHIASSLED